MTQVAIGVDLGGTKIKAGLIDALGNVKQVVSAPTPRQGKDILLCIAALCRQLQITVPVEAIGIGSPGLVSFPDGKILGCTPNLSDWEGRELKVWFETELSTPVVVDNDANVACYGEWKAGGGREITDLVVLTLGTGLGSGQVIGGRLYRGHHALGVGYGHMIVEAQGRWCNCGQRGCLETYVSGKGLVKNYWMLGGRPECKGAEIFDLAENGDTLAVAALDQFLIMLATGVTNIFNTLAPERILLGGGISAQGEKRLLEPLRQKVKSIMSMPFHTPESIQLAQLGPDAGMIGAGMMALDETLLRIQKS